MTATSPSKTNVAWLFFALIFSTAALTLAVYSNRYGYDFDVDEMPVLAFVAVSIAIGTVFVLFAELVRQTAEKERNNRALLALMIVAGLVFRLVMFFSEPILEDDYQRYLWDGALTASGINPFAHSPQGVQDNPASPALAVLKKTAGPVLERVNHPELRTIYPPVAQASFALAHVVAPFKLVGWRIVCLAGDLFTLALILALLVTLSRSMLWAALYWWNPVVVRELFNSAHMEAVLMPLVLGTIFLSIRRLHLAAATSLGMAVGVKVWPILLLPLILRPLTDRPWRLLVALVLAAGLIALWTLPILNAGLDQTSGFVAYADKWETNSALFPALEQIATQILWFTGINRFEPGYIVRGFAAVMLATISLAVATHPPVDARDVLRSAGLVAGAMVLLSPAQFPWYSVWFLVFLPFFPLRGFIVLSALLPLYYSAFYFIPRDELHIFEDLVVWVIWLPTWALLFWQLSRSALTARGASGSDIA